MGTFAESETGPPGTFQGVIDKLPYLQELGINAIELLPVKEFEGDYSWGTIPPTPLLLPKPTAGPMA